MAETGRPDAVERPATPWWVKVIGVAIVVVLILAAIILVAGGGQHGPGMHGSAGSVLPPFLMSTSQPTG
jgi:uncharacterized membrane protein YkvI